MIILGLNAYHADSAAAIFKDGELIAATEEERFRRIKHWAGFPSMAIDFCLEEAGIKLEEVDHITIGRDPKAKKWNKVKFLFTHPRIGKSLLSQRLGNRSDIENISLKFREIDNEFNQEQVDQKLRFIEHHRSHLASAFFASPFEESAILSIDGSGDFTTTMFAYGRGNKITVIDSMDFPCSVGFFYTSFTQFLGFPHYGDEYKVMGLAPYGEPKYLEKLRKIIRLIPNGMINWDPQYFNFANGVVYYENNLPIVQPLYGKRLLKEFGKPRAIGEELTQYHKDIASSVQRFTEEIILHLLRVLQKSTKSKNICIAGGVAQNSVANGKIISNTDFEKLYIPSAGHDAGISMGSALYHYNHLLGKVRAKPIFSAYTGKSYSDEEIEDCLNKRGIKYALYKDSDLFEKVVNKLQEPGVVGWFSGRAEFGPRALGARSILADPRNPEAKNLLNLKIKRRESFRPFAPSILKECAGEYFERVEDVPFMEKVFIIREEKRNLIPAVTHVDGTGRLQTVEREFSPRYHRLIETFARKTGVPILLNTSFNENEPIVNSPEEALECFLRTKMDMLVLENFVIER